jgi:hypothetical protein
MKRLLFLALVFACLAGFVALPAVDIAAVPTTQQAKAQRMLTQDPVLTQADVVLTNEDAEVTENEGVTLEIVAPAKVNTGDLVVLSVDSNAATFEWIVLPSTDNFLVIDEGHRSVFSSGVPGEYTFICAGAKDNRVKVTYFKIQVVGTDQSVVSSKVRALCEKVDDSPTKVGETHRLSQSFLNVVVDMRANPNMKPGEIALETREQNKLALGDRISAWQPFADGLAELLGQLHKAGKLATVDDHIKVWMEIAETLRAYADSPQ